MNNEKINPYKIHHYRLIGIIQNSLLCNFVNYFNNQNSSESFEPPFISIYTYIFGSD